MEEKKGREGKSHSMRDRERKKHKGLCKRDTGDSPRFSFKGQLIDRGRTGEEAWGWPRAGRGDLARLSADRWRDEERKEREREGVGTEKGRGCRERKIWPIGQSRQRNRSEIVRKNRRERRKSSQRKSKRLSFAFSSPLP